MFGAFNPAVIIFVCVFCCSFCNISGCVTKEGLLHCAVLLFFLSPLLARFNKAHQALPSARFPSVIWDVLPKCGASQVHPHLQGFLDPERYHGMEFFWV